MKTLLLSLTLFICTQITGCAQPNQENQINQKNQDYWVGYADHSSGEELYGFKDASGHITIPAKYTFSFTDTMYAIAFVIKDYRCVCINRDEETILKPFIFDNGPDYVSEGLFRFVENNKMGFADMNGNKVIPAAFDFVSPFRDGLSEYTLGGKKIYEAGGEYWTWEGGYETGYINKEELKFKKVSDLKNNRRDARTIDGKYVRLNEKGEIISK